jgi:hypothetical protein
MDTKDLLFRLTGLPSDEVGETLLSNPRAYMSLKGAVAERHLFNLLTNLATEGRIHSFRKGFGDFEKDFYLRKSKSSREISLECKNVQVITTSTLELQKAYLTFLVSNNYIDRKKDHISSLDSKALKQEFAQLPIDLRESGLARYKFSRDLARIDSKIPNGKEEFYLKNFQKNPISIDFQRTRNSRDVKEKDNKSARFYHESEIEIVGACLFTRTLEWDFVFCSAKFLSRHKKYRDCYSNSLIIDPTKWICDLGTVLEKIK